MNASVALDMKNNKRYKLDNAATIYPATSTKDWNHVFRLSMYLKEKINPKLLQQAVRDLAPRFPTFYTQLHRGVFWDSLKPVSNYNIVTADTLSLCRPFTLYHNDKPLFRVLYQNNRISTEFFHVLTDGTGGMVYLKSLVARYLELQGVTIEKGDEILESSAPPAPEELEDSYRKISRKKTHGNRKEPTAYQYRPAHRSNYVFVTAGSVSIADLKRVTKQYQCTITEFLVAVYYCTFLHIQRQDTKQSHRPIRISVPANLRPIFHSKTLRNFAMFTNVDVSADTPSFEQVLQEIQKKLRAGLKKEVLQNTVSMNVASEDMTITQIAPNFLKQLVLRIAAHQFGENQYTSTLSNLGLQKLPPAMAEHVEEIEFILGRTSLNTVNCCVAGYQDNLNISFSSSADETSVPDHFFHLLRSRDIGVTMETRYAGQ